MSQRLAIWARWGRRYAVWFTVAGVMVTLDHRVDARWPSQSALESVLVFVAEFAALACVLFSGRWAARKLRRREASKPGQ